MTVIRTSDLSFVQLPGRRSADPLAGVSSAASVRRVRLDRSADRTAHRHPQSEEVVYVAAGTGQVWIDGIRHPVETGDIVHIPTGRLHATIPDPDTALELICFFPHPDLGANLEETDVRVSPPEAAGRSGPAVRFDSADPVPDREEDQ